MTESEFWGKIREGMKGKWDATRIENSTRAGVPDVTYGIPGRNGWIELKVLKCFPVKPITPVKIGHFTKDQKLWIRNRGRIAGNVWLLILCDNQIFLFSWDKALSCEEWTAREWRKLADGYWVEKIDYDRLYKLLLVGC